MTFFFALFFHTLVLFFRLFHLFLFFAFSLGQPGMIVLPLLSTLLQELGKLLLLNIDIVVLAGCSQVLLRIILELGVYYGSIECDELHVVLGAAAL